MKRLGEHAIVIGGSIGGLLAARAASYFYDRVTVLERDAYPARDEPRKGVPQGRHSHGLLAQGRQVLERFFPGITSEVVAAGGICSDMANDVTWVGRGVSLKGKPSDITGLLSSRPVRRRLSPAPVTDNPKGRRQGALLFLAIGLLAGLMAVLAHQPGEWF
jgi:2-polyprenyl-6-methoxyphenol hydroxylase-like FAD-dependent oxidoreductase